MPNRFESLRRLVSTYPLLVEGGRKWKWSFLIVMGFIAGVLEAVGALLIFALLALVSDVRTLEIPAVGQISRTPDGLLFLCVGIGIFYLGRLVFLIFQTYIQFRVGANAGVNLSARILRAFIGMPYEFHLRRNSAELIRNVNESCDIIGRIVLLSSVQLAAEAMVVLAMAVVLLIKAPLVTAVAGVFMGGTALLVTRFTRPRLRRIGDEYGVLYKGALQWMQQILRSVRDIKVLAREEYFYQKYYEHKSGLARLFYQQSTLTAVPRIVLETVMAGALLLAVVVLVLRGNDLKSAVPLLGLFAYAVIRVMPAVTRIIFYLNSLQWGSAAVDQVYDDLQLAANLERSAREEFAPIDLADWRSVDFVDVNYRYPDADADAVHDLSISISRGESIGVVGGTGAGKSTFVDLLMGILSPSVGSVSVAGHPMHQVEKEWHRQLAFVPQQIYLMDDNLVRNIALGVPDDEIDDEIVREAIEAAQLRSLIEALPEGLETRVGEAGVKLSGGERQRVAIARALYRRPSMLLFDEGTSALDNLTEGALMAAIEQFRGERTIVAVAHRLSTIRNFDRIFFLERGRIRAEGTFTGLMETDPVFREMARESEAR